GGCDEEIFRWGLGHLRGMFSCARNPPIPDPNSRGRRTGPQRARRCAPRGSAVGGIVDVVRSLPRCVKVVMSDRSAQLDADYELMQRVSLDDESAVSELYDRFGPLVYRMAHQMMPTRSDAEDAVQEIFVRLWRTAGRYDPKRAALVTWVMMLSRRILVDRLRRQKARIKASTMNDA